MHVTCWYIHLSWHNFLNTVDADFDRSSAVIAAGSNCVNITTLNDIYYERSKAFTVLLESENMDISINYSVVLKDDDGKHAEILYYGGVTFESSIF